MTFAYWMVLLAALMPYFCALYAKKAGGFDFTRDNADPRAFLAKTEGVAARANAAQQNGFESFAPFAAAVIIAHATGGAAQGTINFWAFVFIAARAAYIWCYINDKPYLRSLSWAVGLLCIVCLFVAAA